VVAEANELAVLAGAPGFEGSGKTVQLFGLVEQAVVTGLVQEDAVVDVPVVIVPLAVRVIEDQCSQKDVASCRSVREIVLPE
jgi:hypothetical protein